MTDNHITDIHDYREQLIQRKLWLDQLVEEAEHRMQTRRTFPVRYQDTLRHRYRELVRLRHEVQQEIEQASSNS